MKVDADVEERRASILQQFLEKHSKWLQVFFLLFLLKDRVVAARKKGRSCQGVKYVFDAFTSKTSKRLKVLLFTFGALM
jgi:hypothetical protein